MSIGEEQRGHFNSVHTDLACNDKNSAALLAAAGELPEGAAGATCWSRSPRASSARWRYDSALPTTCDGAGPNVGTLVRLFFCLQRKDMITKQQFALHLIRGSTVTTPYYPTRHLTWLRVAPACNCKRHLLTIATRHLTSPRGTSPCHTAPGCNCKRHLVAIANGTSPRHAAPACNCKRHLLAIANGRRLCLLPPLTVL